MLNANQTVFGLTACLGSANLALGTTDDKDVDIVTLNTDGLEFSIDGKIYTKADVDSAPLTAGQTIATLKTAILLVCLNSSGTVSTIKGPEVLTADVAAGAVVEYPFLTTGLCPIGALKIQNASSATWTSGTDELDATDVTTTYINLTTVPSTPETTTS